MGKQGLIGVVLVIVLISAAGAAATQFVDGGGERAAPATDDAPAAAAQTGTGGTNGTAPVTAATASNDSLTSSDGKSGQSLHPEYQAALNETPEGIDPADYIRALEDGKSHLENRTERLNERIGTQSEELSSVRSSLAAERDRVRELESELAGIRDQRAQRYEHMYLEPYKQANWLVQTANELWNSARQHRQNGYDGDAAVDYRNASWHYYRATGYVSAIQAIAEAREGPFLAETFPPQQWALARAIMARSHANQLEHGRSGPVRFGDAVENKLEKWEWKPVSQIREELPPVSWTPDTP